MNISDPNKYFICVLCVFVPFLIGIQCEFSSAIVVWHGMGDASGYPFSTGDFIKFLEENVENAYIKSIQIGSSITEDYFNSYFKPPIEQVQIVCDQLASDKNLQNGFHAIGLSQGSQFLRAVIQKCHHTIPRVRNFISLAGQHQGIYGLPFCNGLSHAFCDYVRKLLTNAVYTRWVQDYLVQAAYWHDPTKEDDYRKHSSFLADINNENEVNRTYIENLRKLEHFVLVKFENDTVVQPLDTEWFGFYTPGQSKELQTLQESRIYIEDRLGLQKMDKQGKLIFLSTYQKHIIIDHEWFLENIIRKYLQK